MLNTLSRYKQEKMHILKHFAVILTPEQKQYLLELPNENAIDRYCRQLINNKLDNYSPISDKKPLRKSTRKD